MSLYLFKNSKWEKNTIRKKKIKKAIDIYIKY